MIEPDPKDWMPLDEAVAHIMRVKKCSRRRARRILVAYARTGKLAAIGINTETDEYEKIPADAWPVLAEH